MGDAPTSTDRISPWTARLVLAGAVIAIAVLVWVSLGITEPARRAGPSDLDTYQRVVGAVRGGQGYYPALHEALLAGNSGTLSPLLKRLEGLGLVERRRSAEDERRVDVVLTEAGNALSAKSKAVPQRLADAAGLSSGEIEQLHATLAKLTTALNSSL